MRADLQACRFNVDVCLGVLAVVWFRLQEIEVPGSSKVWGKGLKALGWEMRHTAPACKIPCSVKELLWVYVGLRTLEFAPLESSQLWLSWCR